MGRQTRLLLSNLPAAEEGGPDGRGYPAVASRVVAAITGSWWSRASQGAQEAEAGSSFRHVPTRRYYPNGLTQDHQRLRDNSLDSWQPHATEASGCVPGWGRATRWATRDAVSVALQRPSPGGRSGEGS
jgi:hypothetical protein